MSCLNINGLKPAISGKQADLLRKEYLKNEPLNRVNIFVVELLRDAYHSSDPLVKEIEFCADMLVSVLADFLSSTGNVAILSESRHVPATFPVFEYFDDLPMIKEFERRAFNQNSLLAQRLLEMTVDVAEEICDMKSRKLGKYFDDSEYE
jgi:hypothetical protein